MWLAFGLAAEMGTSRVVAAGFRFFSSGFLAASLALPMLGSMAVNDSPGPQKCLLYKQA